LLATPLGFAFQIHILAVGREIAMVFEIHEVERERAATRTEIVGGFTVFWGMALGAMAFFNSQTPTGGNSREFVRRSAANLCMVRARLCRTFRKCPVALKGNQG
jgi:hypothetical protein